MAQLNAYWKFFEAIGFPSSGTQRGSCLTNKLRHCEDPDIGYALIQTQWQNWKDFLRPLTLYQIELVGLSANMLKQLESIEK